MQVSVEKVSNVECRLTIVVPANEVEAAYNQQLNDFVKKSKIKGFRPGKAPRKFIENTYGGEVRKEALGSLIEKNLGLAIIEQKLQPISTPRVEPKVLGVNQPLEFVASFEVLPEIEKINFALDAVEKLNVEIGPEDITYVTDQLLKQYTKWIKIDRPAQEKDRLVIDYYAIFEGKSDSENKVQNFPLELGSNIMLPGFEEGLMGAKEGEERTLHIKFPDEFTVKEKSGKPVDFVVTVKEAFEAQMPELSEDFIHKLGIQSGKEEDLREQIKSTLEGERNRLVREKLKEQVFRSLLEQNPLDVPNSLVEREAKSLHDEVYQGRQHDHHQHSDQELSVFNETAKKRVALGLLIGEYAKQKDIKADKARVLARIKEIATIYENPQQVVEWLTSKENIGGIEAQVLEDQVLDHLMEGIPSTEKNMGYRELKGLA